MCFDLICYGDSSFGSSFAGVLYLFAFWFFETGGCMSLQGGDGDSFHELILTVFIVVLIWIRSSDNLSLRCIRCAHK